MRQTNSLLGRLKYSIKYPLLVSYNKLPWNVVRATSAGVHKCITPEYVKLFRVAANAAVPLLVAERHPFFPAEKVLHLLPGMMYFIPGPQQPLDPALGWTSAGVMSPTALQYYAQLSGNICDVEGATVYKSGDLRLLCNSFTVRNWKIPVEPNSSIAALGGSGEGTFFHYFRPNRPNSELVAPFGKVSGRFPRSDTIDSFAQVANWTPKFEAKRPSNSRATPMPKFVPPTSYLTPPPERLALTPGDAIGRRSLMWGHWF